MATKKSERELDRQLAYQFNEGRLFVNNYWVKEINARIAQLEMESGITELKYVRDKIRMRWKNNDDGESA